MGAACPLTTLEGRLRVMSGEARHSRDFVGYWVDRLIFYNLPSWVFTVAYVVFAISVTIVFILAPPRCPGRRISAMPASSHRLKHPFVRSPLSESATARGDRRKDAAGWVRQVLD